ncbi:MAG: autotransporter domain-containing protein [Asticcacaulis sp.]
MRKSHLFTATALGLVMAVAASGGAQAETTINTATTAPVKTSNVGTAGAADDIKLDTNGVITLKTAGAKAITVDSNNKVNVIGSIDMSASGDDATAIYIDGGRTSGITVSGKITVTDDYTPTDTDSPVDGIPDGPFAKGERRYGIHSVGTSPFIGDVSLTSTSTLTVEGNNSYGVRFENALTGNFTSDSVVSLAGDNVRAFSFENGVTGNIIIGGTSSAQGLNAGVLNLAGNLNGALILDGTMGGTGYRLTAIADQATLDKLQADDKLQASALVNISGNVTKGILIQSAIADTDSTKAEAERNNDEDGNGVVDTSDGAANLSQFGGAAALKIGSSTQDITINAINIATTATDTYKSQNYGLVVRGSIAATGVFEGVVAKAIETGGLGHTVTFENGIWLGGTVGATSFLAEARGVNLLSGTVANKVNIAGTVRGINSSTKDETAYAVYIGSGAQTPEFNITGTVSAAGIGSKSKAVAIYDASNSLVRLTNNGSITSTITLTDDNADGILDATTNRAVAIDLSGNTNGVTLTQTDLKPDDDTIAAPIISGDIKLGSGNDVLNINGGFVLGNIDFGAGSNSLSIDTKGIVAGKMTGTGTVAINIANGALNLDAGSKLNATTVNVTKDGTLRFIADAATASTPIIAASGNAVFATGAKVQLGLATIVKPATRYTLMTAANISMGTLDTASLDANVPYLYKAALSTDTAKTTLYADVRLRTQSETTLSANEFAAFDAVLTAAQGSSGATRALLDPVTATSFEKAYLSFLPDYSGETLLNLAKSNDGLSRTLASQSIIPQTGVNQYWAQEYGYVINRDRKEVTGFESTGFAFAGGVERGITSTQAAGLYMNYTSTNPTDNLASPDEDLSATDLSIGVYWRLDNGAGLKSWARAGAGYAKFESNRQILEPAYIAKSESDWKGVSYSGSVGASYAFDAGWLSLTPMVSADYFGLKEDAHTETGGGTAYDLAIEERTGHLLSGTALLNIGRNNKNALFRPEMWVGYRNNFSAEIGDTVARFGTGNPFTLQGGDITGGGPIAGLRIAASNEYSYFGVEAEYEKFDSYDNVSFSLRARFQF